MSAALRKQEEALEAARAIENAKKVGRFSKPHVSMGSRIFKDPTPASIERFASMQQPQARPPEFVPVSSQPVSATLLKSKRVKEAVTEQADFFKLLETTYGARDKSDRSYAVAIENYLDDMERQRAERFASMARNSDLHQDRFRPSQLADAWRFQHNFQSRHGYQEEPKPSEPGWSSDWQSTFDRAKGYFGYTGRPRSRSPRGQAHGGPQPGQHRKMSRAKALEIMGFDANSDPTYNDLKQNFKRLALQYHPDKNSDKNLGNQEEAAIKFKKMRKAFNSLTDKGTSDGDTEGGGNIKRRNKRHRTSKKTHRKTHRKTRGKTNKRR